MMKPSICKANDLDISLPEACDVTDWLIPVGKIEEIKTPDRNHAYITPDHNVYVLNQQGTGLTVLEENVINGINQNGAVLNITNKKVNIEVPAKTSELINDSDFVSDPHYVRTDNNYTDADKEKLDRIPLDLETSILLKIYPVGAIYTSTVNTHPSTLFGGVWTTFATGRTIVGIDTTQTEFNTIEKTGGAKTHTLTINEMPTHAHANARPGQVSNGSAPGQYGFHTNGAFSATDPSGGNQAHNNLPPYITVYMWKRTA